MDYNFLNGYRRTCMTSHPNYDQMEKIGVIHQQYINIINSIPDAIYWTDIDCNLIGCNSNFINLMGIKDPQEIKGTPYLLMKNHAHWPEQWVESFRLDDMKVIFSETPRHNVEEQAITNDKNKTVYFRTNRCLMLDESQKVCGLIVVLTDITEQVLAKNSCEKTVNKKNKVETTLENHRLPNILMIEDNLIAQHVESALLKNLNCEVDVAETGDKAVQLFNPGKYDLVLMDIGLADTSGYIVAKQLRKKENGTDHHVPIIALTGYEADVVKYDCEQYCMEGAITKPLTSEQAEQIIKHYIYHLDVEVKGLKSS